MEPRPVPRREATPILRPRSPVVCRQRERVVGFEETPNREGSRRGRNAEGIRPSEIEAREDENRGVNLPPLLPAHLGRNERGQPLRSSLTSVHGRHQPSTNMGGISLLTTQIGNPPVGGISTYHPQGGYIPHAFTNNGITSYNGPMYPTVTPLSNYPFYTQPMYAPPNMLVYPNPAGSFADSTGSVTPFVRWIEDYPLSDGLKMPSHIGSYDGKGDPGNFLHLLKGAIRMQKWLMPVACHMFTYTLKDSARIWWNSQKTGSIFNYEDLKVKFRLHFSQQNKFTKTHLAVHNIIQREGESTMAFVTRYTDNTLQVLGLHEEQRIFGFIHGLRIRSLVEHLSTNLPSTYKGNHIPTALEYKFCRSSHHKSPRVRKTSGYGISGWRKLMRMSTIYGAIKFYTPQGIGTVFSQYNPGELEEEHRATNEEHQEEVKDILNCVDAKTRIVVNDQYPKQTIATGRQLLTKIKIRLQDLLRAYTDVFAWTTAHMTGVPRTIMIGGEAFNTEHKVNELKHLEPVKQKKRSLALERNEAIHTQVEELAKANILREVKNQTWVSNPVIMKKANGRWKLCIDFTDINKACPKEHHSLPMIEQKVEDLHRHRLKCFLDAYKGYHQIPIAEKDEEKTAFYTREGVFCCRRLPFGLKNAGATYQRLIDKVFSHQLGRNMEVNADDIVIKSNVEEEMLIDIKETLDGLRAIKLKLNPKKCSFGVEEGVFSGHLITKQGIKASPSNVKAISDLQPPKTVSEIQNLNRKLATLNRFLSKGADKTLPFMRTLKSFISGKMVQWTTEADGAFQKMKEILEALPTVTTPIKGENLIMYLAASEESISAVLMAERGKKQLPVYFVSRTLEGDELEYPELEKLILTLVYAARRLRRYFQAHPIQILANFLAETPSKEEEGTKDEEAKRKELEPKKAWKLFTDRASISDGSGAGLILVSPEGKEYTYTLRFEFKTTNNEAKYEALLAGLRIAKEMKIQELTIFIYSQLVSN
ncbi:reverse transcriptase domain-containing protein [Tanacetum coccineum]